MQDSQPRGVIEVNKCLSIKGAEDRVNKAHAFEISTVEESMFFIADSDKVRAQIDAPARRSLPMRQLTEKQQRTPHSVADLTKHSVPKNA